MRSQEAPLKISRTRNVCLKKVSRELMKEISRGMKNNLIGSTTQSEEKEVGGNVSELNVLP